jgi:hypothetical protein
MTDQPFTFVDFEVESLHEYFAVIYTPKRQLRHRRFAENCVQRVDSEVAARVMANPKQHWYAAKVLGPSRSSEGVRIYYLVQWLD